VRRLWRVFFELLPGLLLGFWLAWSLINVAVQLLTDHPADAAFPAAWAAMLGLGLWSHVRTERRVARIDHVIEGTRRDYERWNGE
jgi:hypothetical protein